VEIAASKALADIIESRRDRKAREMRRKILRAAQELFTTRGFDAVTMDEISHVADVARGTVFNYFPTKDSLCQGLGELHVEQIHDEIAGGVTDALSPAERIEWLMRKQAELPGQNPEHCRTLLTRGLAALRPADPPIHKRQVFALFQKWVEEGQRSGEFRGDVGAEEIAGFLMGLEFQAVVSWAYGFTSRPLPDHLSHVLRLALEGLRTRMDAR
jgi:AcrR family transcriptional regulator